MKLFPVLFVLASTLSVAAPTVQELKACKNLVKAEDDHAIVYSYKPYSNSAEVMDHVYGKYAKRLLEIIKKAGAKPDGYAEKFSQELNSYISVTSFEKEGTTCAEITDKKDGEPFGPSKNPSYIQYECSFNAEKVFGK